MTYITPSYRTETPLDEDFCTVLIALCARLFAGSVHSFNTYRHDFYMAFFITSVFWEVHAEVQNL